MFYDKKINLTITREGTADEMGIHQPGETEIIREIPCDVQPYSRDLAYRDYGFSEDVTYRIFCDPDPWNDLKVGGFVVYQDREYLIKKIVPWEDAWEVMIYG